MLKIAWDLEDKINVTTKEKRSLTSGPQSVWIYKEHVIVRNDTTNCKILGYIPDSLDLVCTYCIVVDNEMTELVFMDAKRLNIILSTQVKNAKNLFVNGCYALKITDSDASVVIMRLEKYIKEHNVNILNLDDMKMILEKKRSRISYIMQDSSLREFRTFLVRNDKVFLDAFPFRPGSYSKLVDSSYENVINKPSLYIKTHRNSAKCFKMEYKKDIGDLKDKIEILGESGRISCENGIVVAKDYLGSKLLEKCDAIAINNITNRGMEISDPKLDLRAEFMFGVTLKGSERGEEDPLSLVRIQEKVVEAMFCKFNGLQVEIEEAEHLEFCAFINCDVHIKMLRHASGLEFSGCTIIIDDIPETCEIYDAEDSSLIIKNMPKYLKISRDDDSIIQLGE
jgi:hypothetical protein